MNIKSKVRKIKCSVTRELASDLTMTYGINTNENMNNIYKYKPTSKFEMSLIERNFYILLKDYNDVYYSTNNKLTRKLKLLSIDNVELYNNIKKLIDKSEIIQHEEFMTTHLSLELSRGINSEIINQLMSSDYVIKPKNNLYKKISNKLKSNKKKYTTKYNHKIRKPINKC